MPSFIVFVFLVIVVMNAWPLLKKDKRTTWNYFRAAGTLVIVIVASIAITNLIISPFIGALIVGIGIIFMERSVYTKWGLITVGSIALIVGSLAYFAFREDTQYVVDHLFEDENSSMYVAENGEVLVSRQADEQRPLASTVKIVVAAAYAEDVAAGDINPDETVALDDLERFHMENTDGGAHPRWLDQLDNDSEDTVPLQEVVEGMIVFSSNANTDFLLEKIGIESINERLEAWGLTDHDPVYPLVSPLLMYEDIGEEAASLAMEDYRSQVETYHEAIVEGELDASAEGFTLSMDEQKMWSDRLPAATAALYGEWLHDIQTGEWSDGEATSILMDILEAGTVDIEGIESFGQKGGSTAFVLNQAMYVTTDDGDTMELVILNDDLSWWQSFKLGRNIPVFIEYVLEDETFREEALESMAD